MSGAETTSYQRAVHYVTNDRKASTSYIQRKLQIGYNSAAALIERMEREGIVGPADHVGKREILVGPMDVADLPADAPIAEPPSDPEPTPPVEQATAPAPEPTPTGPSELIKCSGCNLLGYAHGDTLPRGWYTQTSPRLGAMFRCPSCAEKNATRIATEHLTTEQILNAKDDSDIITTAAQNRLKSLVERCQRLIEDIAVVRDDLKEVLSEAKHEGFDVKIIKKLLAELQKDPAKRREDAELLDLYAASIGVEL